MGELKNIHFVGIGGTGMGTLAVALRKAGLEITGSDSALYDPMRSVLAKSQVTLVEGYLPETVKKFKPDAVVIGNVITRENPEAKAWVQSGTPFISMAEAVRRLVIRDSLSIVCAGTHGKTTTTSWIAFLLDSLGMKPSYLIGGVPTDLPGGCALSSGNVFVGEGDEYDTAFFDKGPKFLHYNPHFLVLSNIEFDHADIYRDLNHVKSSFEKLVALLPGDGLCVARFDDPVVMEVVTGALCPVQTFGTGLGAMWKLGEIKETTEGFEFEIIYKGRSTGFFKSPLFGEHNLLNLMSGVACATNLGVSIEKVREITGKFNGAKRRQEILLENPILLIDDFAHHPSEVKATLSSVKRRHPQRKLWALFEPRSATARRNVLQQEYVSAFDSADEILISEPYRGHTVKEEERLNVNALSRELHSRGKKAESFPTSDEILSTFLKGVKPGDAAVVMSNGEFGKIQEKLKKALA